MRFRTTHLTSDLFHYFGFQWTTLSDFIFLGLLRNSGTCYYFLLRKTHLDFTKGKVNFIVCCFCRVFLPCSLWIMMFIWLLSWWLELAWTVICLSLKFFGDLFWKLKLKDLNCPCFTVTLWLCSLLLVSCYFYESKRCSLMLTKCVGGVLFSFPRIALHMQIEKQNQEWRNPRLLWGADSLSLGCHTQYFHSTISSCALPW